MPTSTSTPPQSAANGAPKDNKDVKHDDHVDPDAPGAAISVPESTEGGEGGKLKMIVQLVKKCLGVKDIAAMRLSLPSSLLEPIPNLEYWVYLDRPDLFAAINDSPDPLERMIAALRFTFSKEIKFIKGKVCKPYNSVLGEHFRAHWEVPPITYPSDPTLPPTFHTHILSSEADKSETASVKSASTSPLSTKKDFLTITPVHAFESTPDLGKVESELDAMRISGETKPEAPEEEGGERLRVVFLTEQVSHHPPISSFYAACPERGVEMSGVDQISAKVAGTTIKVHPGPANKGIFIRITKGAGEGEQYRMTHPVASVNGVLRGSFYATVSDHTDVTCSGAKGDQQLRALIEYKDEPWIGAPKFLIEGVIHTYSEGEDVSSWTRVKQVPKDRVKAVFEGCWRKEIRWRRPESSDWSVLIDLDPLMTVPKIVRPIEEQLPNESRKLWEDVTKNLLKKEFGEATKVKHAIEQRQRDIAAERRRTGEKFVPVYFEEDISSGIPTLTAEGRKAVELELASGR